jgi:hypothetical protein
VEEVEDEKKKEQISEISDALEGRTAEASEVSSSISPSRKEDAHNYSDDFDEEGSQEEFISEAITFVPSETTAMTPPKIVTAINRETSPKSVSESEHESAALDVIVDELFDSLLEDCLQFLNVDARNVTAMPSVVTVAQLDSTRPQSEAVFPQADMVMRIADEMFEDLLADAFITSQSLVHTIEPLSPRVQPVENEHGSLLSPDLHRPRSPANASTDTPTKPIVCISFCFSFLTYARFVC